MDYLSIISTIITALLSCGCGVLFYRQEKTKKEIENEAQRSDEWRKLYEDSKADSKEKESIIEQKDAKIERLIYERNSLTNENIKLKFQKCVKYKCFDRMPPFLSEEVGDESAAEEQ